MHILLIKNKTKKNEFKGKDCILIRFFKIFLCFTNDEPEGKYYSFMLFIQSLKTGIKKHTGITIACSLPEKLKWKKKWRRGNRNESPLASWLDKAPLSVFAPWAVLTEPCLWWKVWNPNPSSSSRHIVVAWWYLFVALDCLLRRSELRVITGKKQGLFQINVKSCSQKRSCSLQVSCVSNPA